MQLNEMPLGSNVENDNDRGSLKIAQLNALRVRGYMLRKSQSARAINRLLFTELVRTTHNPKPLYVSSDKHTQAVIWSGKNAAKTATTAAGYVCS